MQRRDFIKQAAAAAGVSTTVAAFPGKPLAQAITSPLNKIDHFVVLMLENRSFDSMLGMLGSFYDPPGEFNGLKGTETNPDGDGRAVQVNNRPGSDLDVLTTPTSNPGEDFVDFNEQLFSNYSADSPTSAPTMDGFVKNYMRHSGAVNPRNPQHVMHYFTPQQLPVLSRLALEFAVCDCWFASAPCETWPNRFFLHAGTPKDIQHPDGVGYENNKYEYGAAPLFAPLSWTAWLLSWIWPAYGKPPSLAFSSPTIFNRLQKYVPRNPWKVYWTDFAQTSTMQDVLDQFNEQILNKAASQFVGYGQFLDDCKAGGLPAYSFIEPGYEFDANDQHPPRDVLAGEKLIAEVYNALRNGPRDQWLSAMLIIIYDEHGGMYDHVPPPAAVPPDNVTTKPFNFDRYGVRVPAVIVSPFIKPRTILKQPTSSPYPFDHTTIIATLRRRFSLGEKLSNRDAVAPTLDSVLNLEQPTNIGPERLVAGETTWFTK